MFEALWEKHLKPYQPELGWPDPFYCVYFRSILSELRLRAEIKKLKHPRSSQAAIRSPSTLVLITGCLEAFSFSSRPSRALIPLFVYHIEVDLCQLHLAELGGVGEVQRLWEGRWQAEERRNGNKMCNVLEGRRESRAEEIDRKSVV